MHLVLDRHGRARRLVKVSRPVEKVVVVASEGCAPCLRFHGISRFQAGLRLAVPALAKLLRHPRTWPEWFRRMRCGYKLGGPRVALAWWLRDLFQSSVEVVDEYTPWIRKFDTPSASDCRKIQDHLKSFRHRPLISILLPVYNTEAQWLTRAIESVQAQSYPDWELCIADDASTAAHIRPLLAKFAAEDKRIRVVLREHNGHISAASNTALELAGGELVALLDHDDELSPHALYHVVAELNRNGDWDLLYSDEDKIDLKGRRYEPHFKPQWNETMFLSYNLITHLCVMRTSVVRAVGGFRLGFEGSQDYDLFLRVIERIGHARVRHLPQVLYHWRAVPTSVASGPGVKAYALKNARRALSEHLARLGAPAEVEGGYNEFHRVRYRLPSPLPKVSVIIGTRDRVDLLKVIVDGLLRETDYDPLEILIVDNQSSDAKTLAYFKALQSENRVRVLAYDAPFNFSAINNFAARQASGEVLAFLNNDLKVMHQDWLKEMVAFALRPEVGAVGAKLYYPNDTIQHAGVILGIGGVAGHSHKGLARSEPGFIGRVKVSQNVSAVTGACLVTRREVFERVGGFDQENLAVAFNDVDLCLRLHRFGYRVVWTPFAELYHFESASRGSDQTAATFPRFEREFACMRSRWGALLDRDPCYNPNLTLEKEDFSLAFPPRVAQPWLTLTQESAPQGVSSLQPSQV